MKICVFGNQDNSGYRFCSWFRDSGHDAHLYMMERWESVRSRPEAIDRELAETGYPPWIHWYTNSFRNTLFSHGKAIASIEKQFDVVIVIGSMAMMNAHHIKKLPMINISTGPSNQGVIKMWDHFGLKYAVFWTTVRYFVRKSVRRCQKILVHYDPEIYSLAKLGQLGKAIYYGMPEDTDGNQRRVDQILLRDLNRKYESYDRVFLWLSRIAFSDPHSPMYKGADKFVEGVERILAEGANLKVVIGRHGEDAETLVTMVEAKGLSPYVEWVEHMPYWQLLTYMSIDNAIVFDELTSLHCVSSGMFRECLSVGGVLIRSYNRVLTRAGYGADHCPVLHAESSEDVYKRMRQVLSWDSAVLAEWRRRAREWSAQHLDRRTQIPRLVSILEEVVYSHRTATQLQSWYE